MPTLVTPKGHTYRIASKHELDEFASGRPDVGFQLKGNISQLLRLNNVGSDRAGRHNAAQYFCVEDELTTWMYHDSVDVVIPLFGSAPQRFSQLKERAIFQSSLPTFKRLCANPGKRSEDGWWCGPPPPAVVAGLPDGTDIYGIRKPADALSGSAFNAELPDQRGRQAELIRPACVSTSCSSAPASQGEPRTHTAPRARPLCGISNPVAIARRTRKRLRNPVRAFDVGGRRHRCSRAGICQYIVLFGISEPR